jgi:hypothetical protein
MISKIAFSATVFLALLTAGQGGTDNWEKATAAFENDRRLLVLDAAAKTSIRARSASGAMDLEIEWLSESANIQPAVRTNEGRIDSIYRSGTTTLTRTLLATPTDCHILLHFIADQPGELNFRVSLMAKEARIIDRTQIVASAPGQEAHVWVLPFEAEVATEGSAIAVRGEGEALILISLPKQNHSIETLSRALSELGNRHDPGKFPPDPSKIWHGILDARATPGPSTP